MQRRSTLAPASVSASGRSTPTVDQASSAGRTGRAASNCARANAALAAIRSPVSTKVTSLREPPRALRQTLRSGGGGSPRTPEMRTRSGPSSASRIVSNRATTSGPA